MENIQWRLLRAEDIELRPAFSKNDDKNVKLLLYQNARTAMDSLDDTVGQFNWQMKYTTVNNQIYGELSIYDADKNTWVTKSDCGEKSSIAEDKGEASDIFKRCAVKWGFARELYTAPTITVPKDNFGYGGYRVLEIDYTDTRKVKHIVIVNRFDKEVFRWDINTTQQTKHPVQEAVKNTVDAAQIAQKIITTSSPVPIIETLPVNEDRKTQLAQFVKDNTTMENFAIITKFHSYYNKKLDKWTGKLDIPALWDKWQKQTA